ncbi:asparagine synthase (glutamine-hydrolyzing) [Noviherbaspirillum saxi]|nr:asparagine synthase (glutamine-hydrolyzing) [Noviherbaspirillum saxi]
MNELIRHRGPDDEGFLLFPSLHEAPLVCGGADTPSNCFTAGLPYAPKTPLAECKDMSIQAALSHRRLAIVDLTPSGHQPMCTPDRRYWIVYNGEVYNHIELRRELERCGHQFQSHCDTEVVLAAYVQWGPQCLHRFNGMWAFAIYDSHRKTLFLARDRFGVKPLYYWVAPGGIFCFASEIKQFTAFPGWAASLNAKPAYDFLVWGIIDHTAQTMFSRVYQLSPGHYMYLDAQEIVSDADGQVASSQWYELRAEHVKGTFEDAAQMFREKFTDAVRLHLRADVPVGSCLSGGLDSSSIVCVMNQLLREQSASQLQMSFSACSNDKRVDEREWIEEVVQATGVHAHFVYPALDKLFGHSPAITWHQDEPFGSTSTYAQWSVFRLAAENGVKVMLDGQGADEQLAGYHPYFGMRFAGLLRTGQLLLLWKEIQQTKRAHGYSELHAMMYMADTMLPERIKQPLRAYTGRSYCTPSWLNIALLGVEPRNPRTRSSSDKESIQSMSHAQLTATNLQMLLHWEDRSSMAHSVESRVPFLDHRLVEFVLGLPDDFKLSGGVTKRVMRAGMDGIIPTRIRDRMDKIGFATSEEAWLREGAPSQFRKKMQRAVEISDGVLSSQCLTMLEDMISGKKPFSFLPWRVINFGEWLATFSVTTR